MVVSKKRYFVKPHLPWGKIYRGQPGTVTVTAEKRGSTVELSVTAGGRTVASVPGGLTLTVPAYTTPGTVAALIHDNGTREVVRKSVAGNGSGILDPAGQATRAETAQMLKNFMETQ